MSLVGRLLRFLGFSGEEVAEPSRSTDIGGQEIFREPDPRSPAPGAAAQLDHHRANDPPSSQFEWNQEAWPRSHPHGPYLDLEDVGGALTNDVVSQMQRFRRGREPFPYRISDDEEIDDSEDEV